MPDGADDDFEDDGPVSGEECGRWQNGKLMPTCTKAGSEECDFECPRGAFGAPKGRAGR